MQKRFFLSFAVLAILILSMGCKRDSDPIQNTSVEDLGPRVPLEEVAPCMRCPKLNNFSFSYFDETRSRSDAGNFLLGVSIDNDNTQYGAVPTRMELFDYMAEEDEFKYLNDDPFFKMFVDQLGFPQDTLFGLTPLLNYSAKATQKIEDGFYNDNNAFCSDRCDEDLYGALNIDVARNTEGVCIAPDSLTIFQNANDICAMRTIVDLLSFNLFPFEILDQSTGDLYNEDNFRYEDPFATLRFDNRNLVSDVDFDPEDNVPTDLNLGECPIFRSNDRSTPNAFTMSYDRENSTFKVSAEWADANPLYRANVVLALSEFSFTGIKVARNSSDVSSVDGSISVRLPELAQLLDDEGEVIVFLQIASSLGEGRSATDDTVNSVIFEILTRDCDEL